MKKKQPKTIGSPKKIFKNLDDISLFEEKLLREELETMGEKTSIEPPDDLELRLQTYYDPKLKRFTRLDPTDPEQAEIIKKRGLEPVQQEISKWLKKIPNELTKDQNLSHLFEIEPIIFESKGKTPPSVPYLRVFVESSFGDDETAIHFIHNKTRVHKNQN